MSRSQRTLYKIRRKADGLFVGVDTSYHSANMTKGGRGWRTIRGARYRAERLGPGWETEFEIVEQQPKQAAQAPVIFEENA